MGLTSKHSFNRKKALNHQVSEASHMSMKVTQTHNGNLLS